MDLAEACYRVTVAFPADERFGLISQIRRAAASVPANIAEGYGRDSSGAFIQGLRVAQGSLKELETHILLNARLKMIEQDDSAPILRSCDELGRMLRALIRKLQDSR